MKSEGVKDVVKWMEEQIKSQNVIVKAAEKDRLNFGMYEDCGDHYETSVRVQEAVLSQMISWKISTEKYMKKIKHNGE